VIIRARAVNEEDKQERRCAILAAAEKLFARLGRPVVSVAEVAERAGVAKGTVYLYFRTKEEIFLALHEQWMGRLFDAFDSLFEGESRRLTGPIIGREMARCLLAEPHALVLASSCHSVMETHIEIDAAHAFKRMLAGRLMGSGERIERRFPRLARGTGARLLVRAYATTIGLWQLMDTSSRWRKIEDAPGMEVFKAQFPVELEAALVALWRGALDESK